jgi:hypothetical protein
VVFVPHERDAVQIRARIVNLLRIGVELLRVRAEDEEALGEEDAELTSVGSSKFVGVADIGATCRDRFVDEFVEERGEGRFEGGGGLGSNLGSWLRYVVLLIASCLVLRVDLIVSFLIISFFDSRLKVDVFILVDDDTALAGWHDRSPKLDLVIM